MREEKGLVERQEEGLGSGRGGGGSGFQKELLESILDTGEGRHKYVRRITLLRTIQRHCAWPCRPVCRHTRRVYKNHNYGTDIYGIMGTDSTYSNTPSQTLGLEARRRGQVVCNCRSAVSGQEAW